MNPGVPNAPFDPDYLGAVLDSVPDPILTVNCGYVVTWVNRAAEGITGIERTHAIGRPCYEVFRDALCEYVGTCPMTPVLGCAPARPYAPTRTRAHPPWADGVLSSVHPLCNAEGTLVGGIERLTVFADGHHPPQPAEAAGATLPTVPPAPPLTCLEISERRVIESALRRHEWDRTAVCQEFGFCRTTLWRKMRRLGIAFRRRKRARKAKVPV